MNHKRLSLSLLAVVLIGVCGCMAVQSGTLTGSRDAPPSHPTPAFNCTQDPPGLSLRVNEATGTPDPNVTPPPPPAFLQQIRVEGQGFVPGENISISAVAVAGGGRSGGGQGGGMKVDADGSFVWGPIGMAANTTVEWVVAVAHQRGVACASITTGR
jgi:hypothetical protein